MDTTAQPVIADKKPVVMELEPGTYHPSGSPVPYGGKPSFRAGLTGVAAGVLAISLSAMALTKAQALFR